MFGNPYGHQMRFQKIVKTKIETKTCMPYIPFLLSWYYKNWQSYSHSNIRTIWWNCDLVIWSIILKSLVAWDRFLICIPYKSNYDTSLTSQDIVLENCSLSNRLLNIDTEGKDQGLTVTSSSYGTREAKHLCHKSLRQSGTCHLFITICAPRAPSEYKEALFISIMCDVITYPCCKCVQHAKAITFPQYFWDVITYNIYACRWKYTTSYMSFRPPSFRLLMAISLCDSVLFECGTIKHWNIHSKIKMPTPPQHHYRVLWDAINHPCASI